MDIEKTIIVPFFPTLDEMPMEDISDFLEQNVEKHGIECRNWSKEYPYHPITVFSIAYSKKFLYIDFFVHGNYLRAVNYVNNSPVSQDSCVEFFMQVPGSKEYWNFEFNCIGTVNASHRETRENPTRLNDTEIASIKRFPSCGIKPFEEMEGLFAWNLVVAIPFDLVGMDISKTPIEFRGNFYKCGSKTSLPHYLSWNPINVPEPNFHLPEFFGKIILK